MRVQRYTDGGGVSLINLANMVTFSRMGLSLVLCYILLEMRNVNVWIVIGIFFVAFGSDWLDGFFARKNNKITDFGKIFDPMADKILVFSVLACFLKSNFINPWLVIMLLIREFLMSSARILLSNQGVVYSANMFGKLKTSFQFFAISLLILALYKFDFNNKIYIFGIFFMWCSVLSSFVSLFCCFYENKEKFFKIIRGKQ